MCGKPLAVQMIVVIPVHGVHSLLTYTDILQENTL